MTQCPIVACNHELVARPEARYAYNPPFAPHKDWCPAHGYQPVPVPPPIWRVGLGMRTDSDG